MLILLLRTTTNAFLLFTILSHRLAGNANLTSRLLSAHASIPLLLSILTLAPNTNRIARAYCRLITILATSAFTTSDVSASSRRSSVINVIAATHVL
jgi:hypothetical protein